MQDDHDHRRAFVEGGGVADPGSLIARRLLRPVAAVTAALHAPRMLLALILVALLGAAGGIWDEACGATVPVAAPAGAFGGAASHRGAFEHTAGIVVDGVVGVSRGVVTLTPGSAVRSLRSMVVELPQTLLAHDRWFLFGFGAIAVLLVSLFGGALCRIAALEQATGERARAVDGVLFAAGTWPRLAGALLAPIIAIGGFALVLLVGGALLLLPVFDLLASVLYGLGLVLGLFAALLIIGTAIAFPLLLPAVATERADSLEALQRSIAYLLARPVQMAAMAIVAILGLAFGYVLVAGFVAVALNVTNACVGAWSPATEPVLPTDYGPFALQRIDRTVALDGVTTRGAAGVLAWWQGLMAALVAAWVVSYFFSAATIVYLAAREAVDGQGPEEIWRPGFADGTTVPSASGVGGPRRSDLPAMLRAMGRMRPRG